MSAVTTITPHLTQLRAPDQLRGLQGWLIWRLEPQEGSDKPRKVPYYATGGKRHGVNGRPEDRARLVTFEAACAAAARRGFDGVGLALMPEFGITALDFDSCIGPAGLHPDVQRLVAGTYAEFSPSGAGVRAFVTGGLGNHKTQDAPFGFETFESKGFVTFTGNALPHVAALQLVGEELAEASPDLLAYCAERFGTRAAQAFDGLADDPLMTYAPPLGLSKAQLGEALDVLPDDLSYDQWVAVGMALHHETGGDDAAFELWDAWSSRSPKYSNREYGLERWRSFGQVVPGRQLVTARSLVKMANAHGARVVPGVSLADFEQVQKAAAAKPGRFPVVQAAEFAEGAAPQWLIKGLLPRADLVVLYGESGAGKTFVALDLVMSLAREVPWRGLRVRRCKVVYVAAEGSGGLRKRLQAYARHHGISLADIDLHIVPAAPNLLMRDEALELARALAKLGPLDLVVLDTWAQVTPGGNENAGEDMGKALAHCKGISRATGAMVLLVHHAGKDTSKGARGWSGLRAAADAEIEVLRVGAARVVQVRKQKDGDDQGQWAFDLEEVPLALDADGDMVTSCVVVEAQMPAMGATAKPLGKWETVVNAVIQEMAQAQTSGIEVKAVLAEAVRRMPEPTDRKRDTRKQHAKRALEALCQGDEAPYWMGDDGCLEVM